MAMRILLVAWLSTSHMAWLSTSSLSYGFCIHMHSVANLHSMSEEGDMVSDCSDRSVRSDDSEGGLME